MGVYPIVDRAEQLQNLYSAGITTAQLRVKDLCGDALEQEIREAIRISEVYGARLFINDHWELALKHRAYGVHLGQEDIVEANIHAISHAGIRLGISTHTQEEIAKIECYNPSYIAIGPLFETHSKKLSYNTVGLKALKAWSTHLSCPLVVIGGIGSENIEAVVATGSVDGVAVISAVLEEGEVSVEKTKALIALFHGVVDV